MLVFLVLIVSFSSCRNTDKPDDGPIKTDQPQVNVSETPGASESVVITPPPTVYTPAPVVTPDPTAEPSPSESDVAPVETPSPTSAATSVPTAVPTAAPETISGLTWLSVPCKEYCDLDYDGNVDVIELSFMGNKFELAVTSGKSGERTTAEAEATVVHSAVINDFGLGDNRYEILISASNGLGNDFILCSCLNRSTSTVESFTTEGRVDAIVDDMVRITKNVRIIGVWTVAKCFSFSASHFGLTSPDLFWDVLPEEDRWCTVTREMIICYYSGSSDNEIGYVDVGTKLVPLRIDFSSRIDVMLDTSALGYFVINVDDNGKIIYQDAAIEEYF